MICCHSEFLSHLGHTQLSDCAFPLTYFCKLLDKTQCQRPVDCVYGLDIGEEFPCGAPYLYRSYYVLIVLEFFRRCLRHAFRSGSSVSLQNTACGGILYYIYIIIYYGCFSNSAASVLCLLHFSGLSDYLGYLFLENRFNEDFYFFASSKSAECTTSLTKIENASVMSATPSSKHNRIRINSAFIQFRLTRLKGQSI